MNFSRAIYEHLITKRKYNKLKIKFDIKNEELENKITELNIERRIHKKEKEVWEQKLIEQENCIIDLKKKIRESKSKKTSN